MGAKCAPVFSRKIFEKDFIYGTKSVLSHIKFHMHFIDYFFSNMAGTQDLLICFIDHTNHNEWGLSFTEHIRNKEVEYLDLNIFIENNKIHTRTFFKKVDANSFLQFREQLS